MEVIDKIQFNIGFDKIFESDNKVDPIKSFKIYTFNAYTAMDFYRIRVYKDKIAISDPFPLGTIIDLADGKEKFITDLEFSLIKLKEDFEKIIPKNRSALDQNEMKLRVSSTEGKYITSSLDFDEFVPLFIKLIDESIKGVDENGC